MPTNQFDFGDFCEENYYRLVNWCSQRYGKENAYDLLHDALLVLNSKSASIHTSPLAYLRRIISSKDADKRRRKKVENNFLSWLGFTSEQEINNSSPREDIDDELITQIVWLMIERGLKELPELCQAVIKGLYFQGKSYNEVSEELGISLKAVKNCVRKSKYTLKKLVSTASKSRAWELSDVLNS